LRLLVFWQVFLLSLCNKVYFRKGLHQKKNSFLQARYLSLWLPSHIFRFKSKMENKTIEIMTWGGLRGGLSIAMALLLPQNDYKNMFIGITFTIVLFSILVQGFTIERFIKLVTRK